MIFSREAVEAAQDTATYREWRRVDVDGVEWVTDGTFCVRCEEPFGDRAVKGDPLRVTRQGARTVLSERPGWRVPYVPGDMVRCEKCDGDGVISCVCSCGHDHEADCFECDGAGSIGDVKPFSGQIVLDGFQTPIVLTARFAPFVDAAASLVAVPGTGGLPTVLALDSSGEPIAYLVPMREEPRDPAILGETKAVQP